MCGPFIICLSQSPGGREGDFGLDVELQVLLHRTKVEAGWGGPESSLAHLKWTLKMMRLLLPGES